MGEINSPGVRSPQKHPPSAQLARTDITTVRPWESQLLHHPLNMLIMRVYLKTPAIVFPISPRHFMPLSFAPVCTLR